jgi:hypothetical protein
MPCIVKSRVGNAGTLEKFLPPRRVTPGIGRLPDLGGEHPAGDRLPELSSLESISGLVRPMFAQDRHEGRGRAIVRRPALDFGLDTTKPPPNRSDSRSPALRSRLGRRSRVSTRLGGAA